MNGQGSDHQALLASPDTLATTRYATVTEDFEAPSSHFAVQLAPRAQPHEDQPLSARLLLYASHALSTWGQRTWEFAIGLIMLELYPSSLALVSAYGLVDGLAKVLSGSVMGSYIDKTDRLKAACIMYILQNLAIALSALSALGGLQVTQSSPAFWAAAFCTIGAGSVSSVGAQGSTLSVEKEWTATLCYGDSMALATLNSGMCIGIVGMRAIDLSCLLLAPIAAGFLMTYTSTFTAILAITSWNLAAWAPECYLLLCAQQVSSALRAPKKVSSHTEQAPSRSILASFKQGGWATYFRQSTWPAALALALLYLTVLSLGLLMTAYLKWQGMSEAVLSLYRGAGAVSGLLSTVVFPTIHRSTGLKATGLLGVWLQTTALTFAVAPVWLTQLGARLPESTTAQILLVGLVASRFGLWLFDLSVSQMLQEWIPTDDIGVVNGVQNSLQNLFQSLSYVAGLILWRPQEFPTLMYLSTAVVAAAACVFSLFACVGASGPHRS